MIKLTTPCSWNTIGAPVEITTLLILAYKLYYKHSYKQHLGIMIHTNARTKYRSIALGVIRKGKLFKKFKMAGIFS